MAAPSAPSRINWIDSAKGIGITLVVFGHTLRGLFKSSLLPPDWASLDNWIYAFHMPLFFFLSGLLVEDSLVRKGYSDYFSSKFGRIVWPYFLWSILEELVRHFSGASKAPLTDLWRISYQPVMQYWFLYVIFIILTLYGLWRMTGARPATFYLLAGILQIPVLISFPFISWSVIYEVIHYIPFFALGTLVKAKIFIPPLDQFTTARLLIYSTCGSLLVALFVSLSFLPLLISFLAAIIGIGATIALAEITLRIPAGGIMKTLGVFSLEIYVSHTIFSASLRQCLLHFGVHRLAVHLVAGTAIGLLGPLIFFSVIYRMRFPFFFTFPSLQFAKK